MRWRQVFGLFFISLLVSKGAQTLHTKWSNSPLTISGKGTHALWVCNTDNSITCWFSRPDAFCELPRDSYYRIKEKGKAIRITLKGSAAEHIYYLTKDCYDAEPEHKKHLRYNFGNKGVQCKIKNLKAKCSIFIDQYYPHAINKVSGMQD